MSGVKAVLGAAPIYPPLPTVAELAEEWILKMDYISSANILFGFKYEFKGTKYHFNYDTDDQSNFAQRNTAAGIAITLGTLPAAVLVAMYGEKNGEPDYSAMPVLPADRWTCDWQGHTTVPHTLTMTVNEYLSLAAAAGKHNEDTLAEGRIIKSQLRAVQDKPALDALVRSLDLEEKFRITREKMDILTTKRLKTTLV